MNHLNGILVHLGNWAPKTFFSLIEKKLNFFLETTFSLEEMRAEVDVVMKDASKQTNYIYVLDGFYLIILTSKNKYFVVL